MGNRIRMKLRDTCKVKMTILMISGKTDEWWKDKGENL